MEQLVCRSAEMKTLDLLAKAKDRPKAMEPFDRLLREQQRLAELVKRSAPVVGQYCNFVPDELVLAAGAIPLRLDAGCQKWVQSGEKLLPQDLCCVVRSAAGASQTPSWQLSVTDLVVVPTACDGKKKLASVLSDQLEVFVLELPPFDRSERSLSWWHAEIQRLVERLQKLTGHRMTRRSLKHAVELVNRRTQALRSMNDLRANPRLPISGMDAFLVMHTSFVADCAWWVDKTERLVAELKQRVTSGRGLDPGARLLLTGSPVLWPDYQLLTLVAESGADVVADEMCSATQRLVHPTTIDEWTRGGIIRASAEKVLLPCTCPCFAESNARWDRLLGLVEKYKVDGVIQHTLRLCQLYDVEARKLALRFKESKTPYLELHAEFGLQEADRMKGRIEAFVEMIAG